MALSILRYAAPVLLSIYHPSPLSLVILPFCRTFFSHHKNAKLPNPHIEILGASCRKSSECTKETCHSLSLISFSLFFLSRYFVSYPPLYKSPLSLCRLFLFSFLFFLYLSLSSSICLSTTITITNHHHHYHPESSQIATT